MLLRLALVSFLVVVVIVALVIFLPGSSVRNDWRLVFVIVDMIVFTAMTIIQSSALIYRLAHTSPAIIVREDGIVDNASLIYGGVGFIPWSQTGGNCDKEYCHGSVLRHIS